jgi:hypothetical protein
VHFYDVVRYRAFNSTVHAIEPILSPNSEAFKKVAQGIEEAAGSKDRNRNRNRSRRSTLSCANGESVRATLVGLFRPFRRLMIVACGGTPEGKLNGLPACDWEQEFKSYILSFP